MPKQLERSFESHEPDDVAAYLGHVARELRVLPVAAREDELREIEAHLQAMIEARQSEGRDERAATALALAQFGPPKKVGRELRKAWERKREEHLARALVAAFGALLCNLCLLYVQFVLQASLFGYYALPLDPSPRLQGWRSQDVVLLFCVRWSWLVIPIVPGLWAVLASPKRGWWATLTAYATIVVLVAWVFHKSPLENTWPILAALPALCVGLWCGARWAHKRRARIINA